MLCGILKLIYIQPAKSQIIAIIYHNLGKDKKKRLHYLNPALPWYPDNH